MSELKPPLPPDDDRELDDFLAGRSELSRLYRDDAASVRAPAALDAAVLAAAQASATFTVTGKATTRRWRRWRIPLSLAASMLIGIGVLREARELPAPLPQSADAPVVAAAVAPAVEPATAPPAEAKPQAAVEAPLRTEAESERRASSAKHERQTPALASIPKPSAPVASALRAPPDTEIPIEAPSTNAPDISEEALMPPPPARRAKTATEPWQPARYHGQALGTITIADWQRRYGRPPVMSAPSADAKMPAEASIAETRRQLRLDYGRSVDSRGVLFLQADEDGQRVETLSLRLEPHLPLPQVEQAEGLHAAVPVAGGQAGCQDEERRRRLYPAEGIELRLDGDGQVAEILYRAGRPTIGCGATQSE